MRHKTREMLVSQRTQQLAKDSERPGFLSETAFGALGLIAAALGCPLHSLGKRLF